MTYIDCCTPSLPAPPPPHGGRVRRFIRRLAPVLAPALVVAVLGCREDAESPTAPEPGPALDITPASALSFRQVSAGGSHTCGVTTDDRAYCWGAGGALGDGTTTQRLTPVAVLGGLRFRHVDAGGGHACGVTIGNRAFCWGNNSRGQLGDGTTTRHLTPVAVAGGLLFRQIRAGTVHTCGITLDDRAYCWGMNDEGALGDGTTIEQLTPVAVVGGLRFRQVSTGSPHTCGVTTSDLAYCWGFNPFGQLGDGTTIRHLTPVRVAGGLRFFAVSAGRAHTCGVTTKNRAFCWGANVEGQLGNGTNTGPETCFSDFSCSTRPVRVAIGRRFLRVSAGGGHTCGVTTGSVAFCWGSNSFFGQLGDGTTTNRLTPVRVARPLQFRQVSAGDNHTCGVTTSNQAYCWGDNRVGQLGTGTLKIRRRPWPVADAASTSIRATWESQTTANNQVGVDEPEGEAEQE